MLMQKYYNNPERGALDLKPFAGETSPVSIINRRREHMVQTDLIIEKVYDEGLRLLDEYFLPKLGK